MADDGSDSRRRTFLQGMAAAVVGSLAGASACGPQGGGGLPATSGGAGGSDFTFRASGRLLAPPPVAGQAPPVLRDLGGDLLHPGTGAGLGSFRTQSLGSGLGGMELLQLELAEGALYAVGAAGADRTERAYAILGGTGGYVGVRGSLRMREVPSTGSASAFELDGSLS